MLPKFAYELNLYSYLRREQLDIKSQLMLLQVFKRHHFLKTKWFQNKRIKALVLRLKLIKRKFKNY